ncbi:hypothetical protein GOBAR_DD18555 [Gossypium barbadense]|nr:hypothetical protein GOBAR_DD18555 [Gossypium barbadense]
MAKSPEEEHPVKTFGWAARDPSGHLSPFTFSRRVTGEEDVRFKVLYCGICHSDLHSIKSEWGSSNYPMVPGHEIVGEVTEVGSKVEKVKVGDKVGVGCMVGACHSCDRRKTMAGSGIGGMKETQEMIDFAAKHNIKADIEVISMDYVNKAMERLEQADVRYRFVIDIGNTLAATKPSS